MRDEGKQKKKLLNNYGICVVHSICRKKNNFLCVNLPETLVQQVVVCFCKARQVHGSITLRPNFGPNRIRHRVSGNIRSVRYMI